MLLYQTDLQGQFLEVLSTVLYDVTTSGGRTSKRYDWDIWVFDKRSATFWTDTEDNIDHTRRETLNNKYELDSNKIKEDMTSVVPFEIEVHVARAYYSLLLPEGSFTILCIQDMNFYALVNPGNILQFFPGTPDLEISTTSFELFTQLSSEVKLDFV